MANSFLYCLRVAYRNTAIESGAQDIANTLTTLLQLLLLTQHHRACPACYEAKAEWKFWAHMES